MLKIVNSETIDKNDIEKIINLCSQFRDLENYSDVDWGNNPKCLLYKLLKTNIFGQNHGGLILLYDNNDIVHLSGFNRSEFHPEVFICGVRTLTRKDHRHKLYMSTYTVPAQTNHVLKLGGRMTIYCFDKNKSMYRIFTKNKFNLFLKNKINEFDIESIYKGLTPYEDPVYINYTVHNVLYKMLDNDFIFNWNLIKVPNV